MSCNTWQLNTRAASLQAAATFMASVSTSELFGALPSVIGTRAYLIGRPSESTVCIPPVESEQLHY
jgi:hypothetical protein